MRWTTLQASSNLGMAVTIGRSASSPQIFGRWLVGAALASNVTMCTRRMIWVLRPSSSLRRSGPTCLPSMLEPSGSQFNGKLSLAFSQGVAMLWRMALHQSITLRHQWHYAGILPTPILSITLRRQRRYAGSLPTPILRPWTMQLLVSCSSTCRHALTFRI